MREEMRMEMEKAEMDTSRGEVCYRQRVKRRRGVVLGNTRVWWVGHLLPL